MRSLLSALILSSNLLLSASAFASLDLDALREAVRARDLPRIAQMSEASSGEPLEMYPQYYWLNLQIKQISEEDATAFLNRFPNTPLANRFREDWLKELAARQSWASFEREFSKLDSPSVELQCLKTQAALARNDSSTLNSNKSFWFTGKPVASACNPVFDALFESGALTSNDAWWRIRQALAGDRADFARQLSARVGSPAEFSAKNLAAIKSAPEKQLARMGNSRADRELQLYALELIGRKNPEQAARLIEEMANQLGADDNALPGNN
ncbi:MAG: hypothetical protein ACRC6G_12370 [Deefgea sp.]